LPNLNEDIKSMFDSAVLKALKQIEESLKDGSLMSYIVSDNYQQASASLPFQQFVFQISLVHKKVQKPDN